MWRKKFHSRGHTHLTNGKISTFSLFFYGSAPKAQSVTTLQSSTMHGKMFILIFYVLIQICPVKVERKTPEGILVKTHSGRVFLHHRPNENKTSPKRKNTTRKSKKKMKLKSDKRGNDYGLRLMKDYSHNETDYNGENRNGRIQIIFIFHSQLKK